MYRQRQTTQVKRTMKRVMYGGPASLRRARPVLALLEHHLLWVDVSPFLTNPFAFPVVLSQHRPTFWPGVPVGE